MLHVHVLNDYLKTEEYFQHLLIENISLCGFDTETTVLFPSNSVSSSAMFLEDGNTFSHNSNHTSIIQVTFRCKSDSFFGTRHPDQEWDLAESSTTNSSTHCLIVSIKSIYFQMKHLPPALVKFMSNHKIIKVGADIRNDKKKLKKSYGESFRGTIDLQFLELAKGEIEISLAHLAKKYAKIDKVDTKLGNYDGELKTSQIYYAAMDSYLSLLVFEKMMGIIPIIKSESIDYDDKEIESEAAALFNFLLTKGNLFNSKNGFKKTTLVNTVRNNYQKLANKLPLVEKILEKWVADEKIIHDKIKDVYFAFKDNREFSLNDHTINLAKKIITIHGISRQSLFNALHNSLGNLIPIPAERLEFITQFIEKSIKEGFLKQMPNCRLYIETSAK